MASVIKSKSPAINELHMTEYLFYHMWHIVTESQRKIEEAMRAGADNYITKPLSLDYLEKDVQEKILSLTKAS